MLKQSDERNGWGTHIQLLSSTAEKTVLREQYRQKALLLEKQQFWYRATRQWLRVLDLCIDDDSRVEVIAHRERCMKNALSKRCA
jgi:hypothetical protein